jgi:hypothetical protein
MRIHLESTLDAKPVSLVVSVISSRNFIRTNLNKDRFEQYLETTGPDYVVRINSAGMVGDARKLLEGLEFTDGGDPEKLDIRYRLDFEDQGRRIQTLYVGAFGEVLSDRRALRPRPSDHWIRKFWGMIEADVVK